MDAADELIEHIDDEGNVLEVVTRAEIRRRNLRHRSVGIVVTNSRGEVLVHRRALDKQVWPGRWDVAAGGLVGAGESYQEAARRELAEELGIEGAPLTHLTDGSFDDEVVRAQVRMFHAVWDGPVHFADGEVIAAEWVDSATLRARIAADVDAFVPDSLAVLRSMPTDPVTPSHLSANIARFSNL